VRRTPIGDEEKLLLAEALGDTPETAIAVHLLRRGLCTAYIGDEPAEAAIVQNQALQGDVYAFGVTPTRFGSCLMSRRGGGASVPRNLSVGYWAPPLSSRLAFV
jgi:hypothetical protein